MHIFPANSGTDHFKKPDQDPIAFETVTASMIEILSPPHKLSPARQPYPRVRKNPGIKPDDSMPEAGRKILRFHFAHMLSHEKGTRLGEDIEDLHDMRVATRRLRAAFEIFNPFFKPKTIKKHIKGLRAIGRALGRVRDLDVFMEKAAVYLDTLLDEERPGLEPLLTAWRQERAIEREAAGSPG
jgi:hypothetical protein